MMPARDLPYLADVARLDWALNLAFHAPAGGRLARRGPGGHATDRLPSLPLALAPATALIGSPYPLDRIWTASQPGAPADPVDLDGGGAHLLVLRRPDDAAFVSPVGGGGRLRRRHWARDSRWKRRRCRPSDPGFDLSTSFARLLGLGRLLRRNKAATLAP